MRFSLVLHGNNTKYARTDIFLVHSLRFSLAPCRQVEFSTIVHTLIFHSSPHKLF